MSGRDWRFPDRPHRGARAGRACRGMAQNKHVATAHTVGYLRGVLGYCSTLRIRRSARSGSGAGRGQWAHRTGNRGVASHPPGKNLTRAESAGWLTVWTFIAEGAGAGAGAGAGGGVR